jgi:hypothetical protein
MIVQCCHPIRTRLVLPFASHPIIVMIIILWFFLLYKLLFLLQALDRSLFSMFDLSNKTKTPAPVNDIQQDSVDVVPADLPETRSEIVQDYHASELPPTINEDTKELAADDYLPPQTLQSRLPPQVSPIGFRFPVTVNPPFFGTLSECSSCHYC